MMSKLVAAAEAKYETHREASAAGQIRLEGEIQNTSTDLHGANAKVMENIVKIQQVKATMDFVGSLF